MKKLISLTMTFLLTLCFLASCANTSTTPPPLQIPPKTYTVLESSLSSGSDSSSSSDAEHAVEINMDVTILEEESKKNSSVEKVINGTSYTGVYKYTVKRPQYNADFEQYESSVGSVTTKIQINPKNNDLVGFFIYDTEYRQKVGDKKELTKENCVDIALNYLKGQVSDTENYRITFSEFYPGGSYNGYYWVRFYRYIGETKVSDSVSVYVTMYGDIIGVYEHNLGGMKDAGVLAEHNIDKIEEAVTAKCSSIYEKFENDETCDIVYHKPKILIRLADGTYALQYDIKADITYSNGRTSWNVTQLIVYLD